MAYQLQGSITIMWQPEGAGSAVMGGAQSLNVSNQFHANGDLVQVPGGDSPSTTNISTGCATLATNLAAAINAQLSQIKQWPKGGG